MPKQTHPSPLRSVHHWLLAAATIVSGVMVAHGAAGAPAPGLFPVSAVRSQRPFRDSLAQMVYRDRMELAEVAAGRRSRPEFVSTPPEKEIEPPDQRRERAPQFRPAAVNTTTQTVGTSFAGIGMQDEFSQFHSGSYPPDTMAVVGPSHWLEVINGAVGFYTRSGSLLSRVSLNSFFTVTVGNVTYPRNGAFDPRLFYDLQSGHWFATALEFGSPVQTANHLILAVSINSDPTQGFNKYVVPIGEPTSGANSSFTDYDTLGVDSRGVYVAVRIFPSSGNGFSKVAAIPKAALLQGTMTANIFPSVNDMYSTPQPAQCLDPVATNLPEYVVASSGQFLSDVVYRTITWNGSTPVLSNSSTVLSTPGFDLPPSAPSLSAGANADTGDMRLLQAIVRSGKLWTTRNVGVNRFGTDTNADRCACEWIALDVSSTASVWQTGRIFDTADAGVAAPRFYYYPSLMVNGRGDAAIAFSGASANEFIGCYFAGRLATDALGSMGPVQVLKSGEAAYTRIATGDTTSRWGDYSATSLDPNDDLTLWTVQEYAKSPTSNSNVWGTFGASLLAPPPALNNPGAVAKQGQTGVTVPVSGTGLYDPGSAFPNRLQAQITGGVTNGISNVTVSFVDTSHVTLTFDVSGSASIGTRDIVLTNPDGQSATAVAGLQINAGNSTIQFSAATYTAAEASGSAVITVSRTGVTTAPATVNFAAAAGTAAVGTDFQLTSGTLSFGAGDTSKSFPVTLTDNTLLQGDRTVLLALSTAVGTTLGSQIGATLTITDDTAGPAPTALTATPTSSTEVLLGWQNHCANQDGVRIERQAGAGSFQIVTTAAAGATTFTDSGLTPGTVYTYRVRATHAALSTDASATATANVPDAVPVAPSGLSATPVSPTAIVLAWTNNAVNASGVKIQRQDGTGPMVTIATVAAGTGSWTDTGVAVGTTYTYQVAATNALGDSPSSAQVAISVPTGGKLSISPKKLQFGTLKTGQSKSLKLTVKNTGKGALGVAIATSAAPFTVNGGGNFTLQPKESRAVTVTFAPGTATTATANLSFSSTDATHSSGSISLAGKSK